MENYPQFCTFCGSDNISTEEVSPGESEVACYECDVKYLVLDVEEA
jgi:hypothetical protein